MREYLTAFKEFASIFSEKWQKRIFPFFFLKPHKILATLSSVHGTAIEFVEESDTCTFLFEETDERIEHAVLPQKSVRNVAFEIGSSRNAGISYMGVFFEDYYKRYVLGATGTILVLQHHLNGFTHVDKGGDVKFVKVALGAILDGKPLLKLINGCLWIFGSNSIEDFTVQKARSRAKEDVDWYLGLSSLGFSLFPRMEKVSQQLNELSKKISELKSLISKERVEEKEIQAFLETNPKFLSFGNKYVKFTSKVLLKRTEKPDLIPDFFLERATDGFCDILDIKLPQKSILTGISQRRRFTADVGEAIAQVSEYREYFDDENNQKEVKGKYDLSVFKPEIMILIGQASNIKREDLIKINDRYRHAKIITYDDILKQITYHVEYLRKFVAGI